MASLGHRHLEPHASVGALFETAQSDSDIDLTFQAITWGVNASDSVHAFTRIVNRVE